MCISFKRSMVSSRSSKGDLLEANNNLYRKRKQVLWERVTEKQNKAAGDCCSTYVLVKGQKRRVYRQGAKHIVAQGAFCQV